MPDALDVLNIIKSSVTGEGLSKFTFSTSNSRIYSIVAGKDGMMQISRDMAKGYKTVLAKEKGSGNIVNVPLHEIVEIVGAKGPIKVK